MVDHAVEAGAVRDTILASWTRSQEWDVATDDVELSCEYDSDPDSPLMRAAEPVISDIADQLATEPVSVILTDADGTRCTYRVFRSFVVDPDDYPAVLEEARDASC